MNHEPRATNHGCPLLEQHLEVDAGHFVGVLAAGLGLAGEGLHDAEFQVLGDDVVGADTPAALVIHVAGKTPREGVTAEEGAIVEVEVFQPRIPAAGSGEGRIAVLEFAHPGVAVVLAVDVLDTCVEADVFVVGQGAPFAVVAADEVASDVFGEIVFSRTVVGLVEAVVVDAGFGTGCFAAAEEDVDFAVARLQAVGTEVVRMGVGNRFHRIDAGLLAVLEFAVACGDGQVIVVIAQFGAVQGIEVLQAIGVAADAVDVIAADAEFPVLAAEVIVHFGQVDIGVVAFVRRSAVAGEGAKARADTGCDFSAVIDLALGTDAEARVPGAVVLFVSVLVAVADKGIAEDARMADAVFQVGHADAEVVQLIGIFVSQLVDQGTLFDRCLVHVGHGFGDHFSRFVAGDVAISLEILAVDALDDTGVGQFDDGLVSPAVTWDIDKGIGCQSREGTDSSQDCRSKNFLFHEIKTLFPLRYAENLNNIQI